MTPTYTPITAEEFVEFINKLRPQMKADNWHKAEIALTTLAERGMPDPSTYSLERIVADDNLDLNLKMHLAIAPPMKAWSDGAISSDAMNTAIMPLMHAMLAFSMNMGADLLSGGDGSVTYPVTLETPKQEAA